MKTNYSNLSGYARSTDGVGASVIISQTIEIVNQTRETGFKQYGSLRMLFKSIAITLAMLVVGIGGVLGQITAAAYTHANTTTTYTAISGTQLIAAATDDGVSGLTNIGFNFVMCGVTHTQFSANSNGYIQLGSVSTATNRAPLSTATTSNYSIAGMARDGKSGGAVTYLLSGVSPNRVLTVQFATFYPSYSLTTPSSNFQIKLYETTNAIQIVYGAQVTNTISYPGQVGFRGAAITDFANRMTPTASWASSSAGTAATSTMAFLTATAPSNGRVLTWTPPLPACPITPSPATAATAVAQLPTLSWAAVTGATGYDVYLGTTSGSLTLVSSNQAGTTYSPSLSALTLYYWRVVSRNQYGPATGGCTQWSFTTAAPTPTISVGTLTAFGNACVNSNVGPNSFTVSGINLTANVNLAALSGYSYCLTSGGIYTSTLSIPASGTLASTLVYVKFNPTAASAYGGNIVATSTGANTQNVVASGTGVNTSIATQPSAASATYCPNASATALTISATAASGSTFSYQWYSNTSASTSGGSPVGTNAASYTPLTTSNGTLYYYCVVSGCGTSSATSTVSGAISTGACINMTNGSTTLSGNTNFYDDGGPGGTTTTGSAGNYAATQSGNRVYTVNPASCNNVRVTFNVYALEACLCDWLKIYNGNSTSAPLIGQFYNTNPGAITSTAADGSLTFEFYTDGSVNSTGWDATLSNVPVASGPAAPTGFAGLLNPEVGSTQTYSVTAVAGATYAWSFPSGWVINSGQGTNSVSVTVGGTNGNISVTPTRCSLAGTAYTVATTIPNYRWKYVSSNLGSATWTGGEARNVSITIKNTGVATWNTGSNVVNLGVKWNPWSDYHVRTTVGSLAPGATQTYSLPIEARNQLTASSVYGGNLADGNYTLVFDLVTENCFWFAGNPGTVTCNAASVICLGNSVFTSATQTVSTVPTLSCSALTAFGNVCSNATATNSFTVSGVNLTNNVSIAALSGYSYSTSAGGTYTSTLTLTPASGAISQTIYVKFTPGATGVISGNIVVSCSGASPQNVAASGTGIQATTVNAGSDFSLCSGQTVAMNASTNATSSAGSASSGAVTASGTDNTNPTGTYTFTGLPTGAVINGITVNITSAGGSYCPTWYSVTTRLNGVQQGVAGCATNTTYTNLNGQAANGLVVAVRGQDNDAYGDAMTITYTVTLSYYVGVSANPVYAWSPPTGLSATNILNPTCSASSTTTYTLTVTGTNGCIGSDQVAVTVAGGSVPPNPTAAVSGATTINVGGTTTLTSTATDPVWYTAATGGTAIGTGTPFTTPIQCASGDATYYVEDNNGTCASNGRGAVSFTVRPMLVSNPTNALICQTGGSVTLSAQLTGASGITWSPNTNLSTTSGASTVASPSTTTVYTMTATVAGCVSAVTQTKNVGVIDPLAFTPTSSPPVVCAGNPVALNSNLATAGFTVSPITCSLSTVPGSGVTTLCALGSPVVTPTSTAGVYLLDDSGWGSVPIGFTYNFFGTNYSSLNVGTNGVVQFGAYNAAALADFTYTTLPNAAEPLNIIALAANDNNLSVTGAASSIQYWTEGIAPTRVFVLYYNQAVQYATGPGWTTGQIKLFETTGIVETHITTSTSTNNKVVGLQNFDASIGAMPYSSANSITNQAWKFIPGATYSFQWATAGSNIGGATATSYPTPSLSTPGIVTYSVAAYNPNTQCTTTQSVNITVNSLPAAPNSLGDVTACSALGNQSLAVTTGAGETADWFAASTGGTVLASGDNVLSYSTATAGTYYAAAQNTTTGCSSATRTGVTLNVNTSPAAPTVTTPVSYCQGATPATLTATPSPSNALNWYSAAPSYPAFTGATALGSAPMPTTSTAATTNYYVSQVDPNNSCESPLALVAVTVNATPAAPVVSNPAAYCQGASASALSAPFIGGNTSYWYTVPTGGTGDAVAPIPSTATAGTTDYYVADRNNASTCEGSRSTITVTVNPTITASVSNSASSTSACGGGAITFTATPTNGGTPAYQWTLNGNPVGTNSATYTSNPATDNAVNYSGTWNNGSNQGTGMGAWSITNGANSGQFIGNPLNDGNGTAGIGTTAHGIYASGSAYINTTRGLTTPMQIGDVLRFYWIFNWDASGGNKGFDLRSGGSTLFNVNNGGSAAITVTGGATADANYGTTPMYVEITRTSGSQYTFSMTRRSNGSTSYSTTFNSATAIDAISFYIGAQNDGSGQRNLYFNGLEIRPLQANDNLVVSMTPSAQSCLASVAAVTSNTITLTSTASTPTVAIQSTASSAICPGTSVTFSVNSSANMGASPTYQWNLNGTPITGATNASFVSTTLANNDQVTLTMTSSLTPVCLTQSSATSAAVTATVNNPTAITTQPVAASACLGASQNFTVAATGTGTLTYQWKKNGSNVTGNGTANTATLTVSGIAAGDAADYTVDVIGTCGTVTSSVAALTLNSVTAISAQPSLVTQCAGTTANFSVTAAGQGTLSYQWRKDGTTLVGETNATLAVANIATLNAGQYSVVVSGGCGNVTSSNALLTVNTLTAISAQPTASTLCAGNAANFSVTASGTGALSYQWKRDGTNVGTNSASLSIVNSQAASAGTYTVDVTGTCGTVISNSALLTVNPLTSITTQPVATSGCEGLNTTFSVVAAGTGALTYQWKFGGVNITGATDATYTISNTTAANNDGSYLVAVTGGCGVVNSNTVALSVFAQPTISVPTSTAYLCLNNTPVNITHTTTNVTDIASSTGLPAGVTATYASNTITISGPAQAGVGTWNYVITPTGCATSASGPVSASGTISAIATAAPAAVASTVSVPLANGDLLWTGLTSPLWGVNSNWYEYNSTLDDFVAMIDNQPASSDRVFILPSSTSGICISPTNNTLINAAGTASDVYIGTGATMVIDAGQSLEVRGNWTNNGTFTPNATSTVTFNGSGAKEIRGSTPTTFNNLTVNKTSGGSLTLQTPATVAGTLTMTAGNIVTRLSPTVTNLLTVGTSAATGSTGSIAWTSGSAVGPIKRWFAAGITNTSDASTIFPVGLAAKNRWAKLNFTSGLTTGGSVIAEYKAGLTPVPNVVITNPTTGAITTYLNYAGLPAYVNGHMVTNYENEGYWEITPTDGNLTTLNAAQYSLALRGNALTTVSSAAAMSQLRMIKSRYHTSWDNVGIGSYTSNFTGSSNPADFTITNTGMTGFSWFNIGSGQISWLPVELTNFAANCNEKSQVDLKWSTASEQNSEYFNIERSRDLVQWEYVSTVNAAGNSNYNIDYSTVDTDPFGGISYYRLVQVDNNGAEKIYGPISVSCSDTENSIIVFPNPTQGNFTVEISSTEIFTNAQLQITDLTGKIIHQRSTNILEGKNQFTFEGLELQMGTYIINLTSVNGKINPVRVVVN